MTKTIFLTGGGGFVGKALRARLVHTGWRVLRLTRSKEDAAADDSAVLGDLLDPKPYSQALNGVDVVVHLAAITGKASPKDYWAANVDGARALLEACKAAGVPRFLHVSTIAAGYADRRFFPYANSKLAAEELVRASGLAFTILRPTVVIGPGSPVWDSLQKIARLPVIPLPQGKQPVRTQPVDVRDVARAIEIVVAKGPFEGEILDVGGADSESFADFLLAVRRATVGKPAPIIRAPLEPVRLALALLEPVARPVLPVTAGQLALFANNSDARPNWLDSHLRPRMASTAIMLANLSGAPEPPAPLAAPDPADLAVLEAECDVFTRCLSGAPPSAEAVRHYIAAARTHGLARDTDFTKFDRTSLAAARRSPWQARCADAFCAFFHRTGALRRKMIMLAAILENQSPTYEIFEAPQSPGPVGAFFQLAGLGLSFGAAFVSGIFTLGLARFAQSERP